VFRHRLALALVAALVAVPVGAAAVGTQRIGGASVGEDGIGDAYFPLDGNGGYDVVRYAVHDTYVFGSGRLSGTTLVTLRPQRELSQFNLDFLLPVSSVRVDGEVAAYSRPVRHELQITPATPVAQGAWVRVEVRYAGFPSRYSYAGESNWLASGTEVVAMNQPHMAPWWFPANDHPLDKAKMLIDITVPTGKRVVANGRPAGRERHGSQTTWRWRADEPMVPYLAFFAAGHFEVERGTLKGLPWLVAVSRSLPADQRTGAMTLMRRTPQVVRWLQSQLGTYPFDVTGGLVTSLNPGFALETQTRPTYPSVGPDEVYLIVHELAHQWFGDDVAVRHWRDIWLNEGFATYMEKRYDEAHGGTPAATWLRTRYDGFTTGNPIWALDISDPGPDQIFSNAVYLRGAMALQALRNRIGDTDFDTLLRTWVAAHSRGNGSTEDFTALATAVSGQDLTGFFDAWLVSPTRPDDTVENGVG
jgi:aminopeptidase N